MSHDVTAGFGDGSDGPPHCPEDPDNDEQAKRYLVGFTDYPFVELGDVPGEKAPIRLCWVWAYDFDKYVSISLVGHSGSFSVKGGYVYKKPGRYGEVPSYTSADYKEALRDKCEVCEGERGGTYGNENVVDGVIKCDYCTADDMNKRATTFDAPTQQ